MATSRSWSPRTSGRTFGGARAMSPRATSSPPRGRVLDAAHIGVLASVDVTEVRVHPRARVAILPTGDEIVEGR